MKCHACKKDKDDFEIADHNDMGKIPRVEDGKLIIANPAWGS